MNFGNVGFVFDVNFEMIANSGRHRVNRKIVSSRANIAVKLSAQPWWGRFREERLSGLSGEIRSYRAAGFAWFQLGFQFPFFAVASGFGG